MSSEFAARISALRKEKNITQKAAADALGISQALLSHYEKGIRECNLSFIVKVASYYEVTTDYLLGYSDSRYGSDISLEDDELESDSQLKPVTIMRSLLYLLNKAQESQSGINYFNDYFSLSIIKYLENVNKKSNYPTGTTDFIQNMLEPSQNPLFEKPTYLGTVSNHADEVIEEILKKIKMPSKQK